MFVNRHCDDVELEQIVIDDVNKELIKAAKVNPDIFMQVALQLAYYK